MITSFTGENRWLSNFIGGNPIQCSQGLLFNTVENAYQASKSNDVEVRKRFINITPGQAKRLGRKLSIREDWESVKIQVMEDLLRQKFCCSPFRELLLNTSGELVEGNTWGDKFWGVCNGTGENNLGKLLMKIRSELNK